MNTLNREILRLSVPSILANLTVPLVGMVDTAVAGHLQGGTVATFISAISVGAMLFTLLYWNFFFLRTGTGGLTAQAYGAGDMAATLKILLRGLAVSAVVAAVLLAVQRPFVRLALLCTGASPEVEELAARYFFVRVWAAPATLSLMVFSGWFVGMQDSVSSMWKDFVVNGVNIAASIILSFGMGDWKGLGFTGVALGTVIAQYAGLLYCLLVFVFKYRRGALAGLSLRSVRPVFVRSGMRAYIRMNGDLVGRSIGFTAIYIGYTMIASLFGDMMLACSSIMMQLLMVFSYFTDGFAYAGEALVGRFIGARDPHSMRLTVKYVFIWSMSIAVLFIGVYRLLGVPMLRMLTSDVSVIQECRSFLPWLILMPPLGCAAFTWDGIYLGAAASKEIRNAMLLSALLFFASWFALRFTLSPQGTAAIHCLLGAYFVHLAVRTVYLSVKYRYLCIKYNS